MEQPSLVRCAVPMNYARFMIRYITRPSTNGRSFSGCRVLIAHPSLWPGTELHLILWCKCKWSSFRDALISWGDGKIECHQPKRQPNSSSGILTMFSEPLTDRFKTGGKDKNKKDVRIIISADVAEFSVIFGTSIKYFDLVSNPKSQIPNPNPTPPCFRILNQSNDHIIMSLPPFSFHSEFSVLRDCSGRDTPS